MRKSLIYKSGAVILALAVWQGISMLVNMDILLASPIKVVKRLFTIWE